MSSRRAHSYVPFVLLLSAAVLAPVLLLGGCGRSSASDAASSGAVASGPPGSATVTRVIDGDTIVVSLGGHDERVRLIGIDTPETVSPVKPVQCYGKQASNHTKALLPPGTAVRLVGDVEARDMYGRLLAYVYRRSDGLFVNLELATDGFASLLTYPPDVAHATQFRDAVSGARQRDIGLWRTCGGPGVPASVRH